MASTNKIHTHNYQISAEDIRPNKIDNCQLKNISKQKLKHMKFNTYFLN